MTTIGIQTATFTPAPNNADHFGDGSLVKPNGPHTNDNPAPDNYFGYPQDYMNPSDGGGGSGTWNEYPAGDDNIFYNIDLNPDLDNWHYIGKDGNGNLVYGANDTTEDVHGNPVVPEVVVNTRGNGDIGLIALGVNGEIAAGLGFSGGAGIYVDVKHSGITLGWYTAAGGAAGEGASIGSASLRRRASTASAARPPPSRWPQAPIPSPQGSTRAAEAKRFRAVSARA